MMKKIRIHVYGRVQGVGFRYMTKMAADKLGIKGTVRNEADGSVTIEAIGASQEMAAFLKAVQASPSPSGRVTKMETRLDPTISDREKFVITN